MSIFHSVLLLYLHHMARRKEDWKEYGELFLYSDRNSSSCEPRDCYRFTGPFISKNTGGPAEVYQGPNSAGSEYDKRVKSRRIFRRIYPV